MTAALTAVANNDTFPPGPNNFLRVKNAGAAAVTVTVMNAAGTAGPSGTFLAPLALAPAVAAAGDRMYGPFPGAVFADASDGQVHVSYSAVASVTAGVYSVSDY
jgi:hypothetical protein